MAFATNPHGTAAVQGLNEAVAAFKRAPELLQARLGDATSQTAFAILQAARSRVSVRYGFLKDALDWNYNARTGEGRIGIRKGATYPLPEAAHQRGVAKPSKYGHLVEFGHGGPHPAAPHPFMIPSAEAEKDNYLTLCREAGQLAERDLSAASGGLRIV